LRQRAQGVSNSNTPREDLYLSPLLLQHQKAQQKQQGTTPLLATLQCAAMYLWTSKSERMAWFLAVSLSSVLPSPLPLAPVFTAWAIGHMACRDAWHTATQRTTLSPLRLSAMLREHHFLLAEGAIAGMLVCLIGWTGVGWVWWYGGVYMGMAALVHAHTAHSLPR
jgi:hypothetical protein